MIQDDFAEKFAEALNLIGSTISDEKTGKELTPEEFSQAYLEDLYRKKIKGWYSKKRSSLANSLRLQQKGCCGTSVNSASSRCLQNSGELTFKRSRESVKIKIIDNLFTMSRSHAFSFRLKRFVNFYSFGYF